MTNDRIANASDATSPLRLLFIGDIVGKPGRNIIKRRKLDLVVANAENAAAGSGITPAIYHQLIEAGIDAITLGDHVYRRKEIYSILRTKDNIVRPANLPEEAVGRQWTTVEARNGTQVAIFCLLGQLLSCRPSARSSAKRCSCTDA